MYIYMTQKLPYCEGLIQFLYRQNPGDHTHFLPIYIDARTYNSIKFLILLGFIKSL